MATNFNTRSYAKNWFETHGPQTRGGLIDGFKAIFTSDLAEKAVDDLFREELIMANDDGVINWVGGEA